MGNKEILLREKPYIVSKNNKDSTSIRINLNPDCGLNPEEKVFQILDNGILILCRKSCDAKGFQLRKKPYTIMWSKKTRGLNLRIVLNQMCGFQKGDKIYQVLAGNIVKLIPEKIFDRDKYRLWGEE